MMATFEPWQDYESVGRQVLLLMQSSEHLIQGLLLALQ